MKLILVPEEPTDEMAMASLVNNRSPEKWIKERKRIFKIMSQAAPKPDFSKMTKEDKEKLLQTILN